MCVAQVLDFRAADGPTHKPEGLGLGSVAHSPTDTACHARKANMCQHRVDTRFDLLVMANSGPLLRLAFGLTGLLHVEHLALLSG